MYLYFFLNRVFDAIKEVCIPPLCGQVIQKQDFGKRTKPVRREGARG
ncbi:MAG: hypothetical protein FD123_717 [Bacteroidetes bacterium]|nr:MAG: hypothetical protein FD123_717 [Bacteroidota bacterium]